MNSNEVNLDEIISNAKKLIAECRNSLYVEGIDTVADIVNMFVNSYGATIPAHTADELHTLIQEAKNTVHDVYVATVETIKEKQCWELIPNVMEMQFFSSTIRPYRWILRIGA